MTTYDCFKRAEAIERLSADIYVRLADQFAGDASISSAFRKLAAEELQHAARICLFRNQYRSSPGAFAPLERLDDELNAMEAFATCLREDVLTGRCGNDLGLVRPRVVEMEERLGLHAERMARGADPRIRRFFEALVSQDNVHRRWLATW